ncbi:cytochrome c oxidase, cbb3-type, subunit II (plasmid) [Ruegeria pomeroyi DSS-3]|uniref:Cytochrome c oxidase, cbb3-type, subunit II n=2 Tax=Ruegeria pomeroyi TaxID=89184 RepID=Q5LL40_RUEPO|nr:cytochrome-c oxidase, cbb3-type subunit II [Ruegeria pomeroyi]AAV97323.1 cytochrome c oxidase, cbb3-type, subunit II [Ruegeria pomeroyi DSS-3]NVK96794.1 cytochrome-c oxidase, cbb3-type subunit II [Ruegeria pomeroyi]NVL00012.1 cytochrome-c oxidase, cbb3-type subunit II [Ruegeria pomeroyi]HCE71356.1 cytochrome-c oxidase, cbb3-type subunit II [Ruegeria sp.]
MSTAHQKLERHSIAFAMMILFVASIGGIVEIAPLFTIENTVEEVEGMRPYTPLELAGRDIYVREGCYACHSQMIRTLRSDVERYGHYSLAAESMYDHPFQWGSKRTGPDLARIGGKYSDDWHVAHLEDPRALVPGSVMPGYAFLSATRLDTGHLPAALEALRRAGVPYTDAQIATAEQAAGWQADAEQAYESELQELFGDNVQLRDFDGRPGELTEMDALVAYLQVLGTLVNFDTLDPEEINR